MGPEEKRFSVHKEAICAKSKFFAAACSKRWIEGQEKLVRLPETKAEAFKEYCKWVYSGVIPNTHCTPTSDDKDKIDEKNLFISLYLLGDSLEDVQLRNVAIQAFCNGLRAADTLPQSSKYTEIWSSTPSGSRFRKQLVDLVLARYNRDLITETIAEYPPEFTQELALAALRKVPIITWEAAIGDNTKYLEPEEAEDKTT